LLQTVTDTEGECVDSPQDLNLTHRVSQGCTAGVQYVRVGNTTEGMIDISVHEDGKRMRYVPVGAGGAIHEPLAIVDELQPGTEIPTAAAAEESGTMILDVGILEINTP